MIWSTQKSKNVYELKTMQGGFEDFYQKCQIDSPISWIKSPPLPLLKTHLGVIGSLTGVLLNLSSVSSGEWLLLDSVVLLPSIFAFIGFFEGFVTSLAVIITFWLGPLGPSVPSLTATPKDWPEVCSGMKYVVSLSLELPSSSCLRSSRLLLEVRELESPGWGLEVSETGVFQLLSATLPKT